jgi:hypothetical protein
MHPATDIFISNQQMVASIVVLPLMYGDQNLGGLYFTLEQPSNFQNIKDMLMGFVNSIVLVLLQKLEGRLEHMWDAVVQVRGRGRGGGRSWVVGVLALAAAAREACDRLCSCGVRPGLCSLLRQRPLAMTTRPGEGSSLDARDLSALQQQQTQQQQQHGPGDGAHPQHGNGVASPPGSMQAPSGPGGDAAAAAPGNVAGAGPAAGGAGAAGLARGGAGGGAVSAAAGAQGAGGAGGSLVAGDNSAGNVGKKLFVKRSCTEAMLKVRLLRGSASRACSMTAVCARRASRGAGSTAPGWGAWRSCPAPARQCGGAVVRCASPVRCGSLTPAAARARAWPAACAAGAAARDPQDARAHAKGGVGGRPHPHGDDRQGRLRRRVQGQLQGQPRRHQGAAAGGRTNARARVCAAPAAAAAALARLHCTSPPAVPPTLRAGDVRAPARAPGHEGRAGDGGAHDSEPPEHHPGARPRPA